jgi:hypothetical protein
MDEAAYIDGDEVWYLVPALGTKGKAAYLNTKRYG